MKHSSGHRGRLSISTAATVAGMAALMVMLFSHGNARAAEGDPFAADFNYAGLYIGTTTGDALSELVLTPETTGEGGTPVGPLEVRGTYTDGAGNFTLPQATGFSFPTITIPIRGIDIDGDLALVEPATGNYDPLTGSLSMDMQLYLTLSLDEISTLPDPIGGLGSGPLECRFGPIDVSPSTNPTNWPAPGTLFTDKENLTDGAVAGGWNVKPVATAISGGTICGILAGSLDAVGGVYLANSSTPIAAMPDPTAPKPVAEPCPEGTTGPAGSPDECEPVVVPPPTCPFGQTGTPPDCVTTPIEEEEDPSAEITKVAITGPGMAKAGKSVKLTVKVTNTGDLASGPIKVSLKSGNSQVKVPKSVSVNVPAGKTVSKKITVKAGKKAKGKATITARYGSRSGKKSLKVKAASKK